MRHVAEPEITCAAQPEIEPRRGSRGDATRQLRRCHRDRNQRRSSSNPNETTPTTPRPPLARDRIPAGWPDRGQVEFIRFIRSDHKLRLLGRAIPMPDGTAYQYLTATIDLALTLTDHDNLHVSNTDGELITTARLPLPRR
jgi:hypothetical protein